MDASQANSMLNSFDEEMEDFELENSHREGTQLITFILGSEKYGLKILKVRELISYPEVMTRIPGMPDFIVGMINLRGLVIPVIDLRLRFGMDIGEYDKYTVIIIVQVENKMIGMIVDSVADVVYLEDEKTQASSDISTNIDTQFIQGVANIRDDMVILLDVDHLLSEQELVQLNN